MRAVTAEEIERIAGGLRKLHPHLRNAHAEVAASTIQLSSIPVHAGGGGGGGGGGGSSPPASGGPISVTGSGGPSSLGGDGGGGGVSGLPASNPLSAGYKVGKFTIDATHATEKISPNSPGYYDNNAGNLEWRSWEAKFGGSLGANGFANFSTPQGGVNAMAHLLDTTYGSYTMQNFVTAGYNGGTVQQQDDEINNITSYMAHNGYPGISMGTPIEIQDLSNAEFNTFLNAVIFAEGQMNPGGGGSGGAGGGGAGGGGGGAGGGGHEVP